METVASPDIMDLWMGYALLAIGIASLIGGVFISGLKHRQGIGDALSAFGMIVSAAGAETIDKINIALILLVAISSVRLVTAALAAQGRPDKEDKPAQPVNEGEITVRFKTPITRATIDSRPERPRDVMEAVLKQLGDEASVVSITARKD